tara:strand:- start:131 stop:1057 length:927 start_codon:yes stop_codon:yes gene_type:complete
MKLNDFQSESFKGNDVNLRQRLGRNSNIRFTNETKEAAYQAEIDTLTQKVITVDKISAELQSAKIQRTEAVKVKDETEKKLSESSSKLETLQASLQQFETREPHIKQIIEQHRELNGQVAELQSKLQVVIEQHDQKVDLVNTKIIDISNLKDSLHKAELSDTKATQASIEAIMNRDALQATLDQETKKSADLSIIYQEVKDELFLIQKEKNEFEVTAINADAERDKVKQSAQGFKTLSENQSEALKDLASQYYYISKLNKDMLEELKKPRFASVASISKKEGFKFPNSYEPRSNTLGTGKPTLLRKKD